jgi:hypothetical protein
MDKLLEIHMKKGRRDRISIFIKFVKSKYSIMTKHFLLLAALILSMQVIAQTGIGTTTPHASAKLEVASDRQGFLPPRVTLTSVTDVSTISTPATGLLIYNTGNNVGLAAGYYYWNGNAWATIATAGGSGSVAAEYGAQFLSSNVSVTSPTPVDAISFTLPSAGIWEVITFLRAQGTPGFASEFAIFDASNNVYPNSEILPAYGENASTGTGVVRIETTGPAVYKVRAWASNGAFVVTTDNNGRTGVTWKKISGNAPVTVINFGDVKTGFQSGDHSGWVRLNGRAKSTLSTTQQAQATALGIGTNLPDATNAYLVQNGRALGDVFGDNTKTIAKENLPLYDLPTATTNSTGNHTHTFQDVIHSENRGQNNRTIGTGATSDNDNDPYFRDATTNTAGSHNHTVTVSSGGSGTAFNITPRSLSVNTFIYLGY